MKSPVSYQGAKSRIAGQILDRIIVPRGQKFYDLCCGGGSISLALVDSGHDPRRIVMVDSGPWGFFWRAIGAGTFDVKRFAKLCGEIPTDKARIKDHMENLYRETPKEEDIVYKFLLLQGAAIGGSAISLAAGRWRRSSGFRSLWLPTETSRRRVHVNPMMPMPKEILRRVEEIASKMYGVVGYCSDASTFKNLKNGVVYIDPPYDGTSGYSFCLDAVSVAKGTGLPTWVSEGRALSDVAFCLSQGRAKGGITGDRRRMPNQEWLSYFGDGA